MVAGLPPRMIEPWGRTKLGLKARAERGRSKETKPTQRLEKYEDPNLARFLYVGDVGSFLGVHGGVDH